MPLKIQRNHADMKTWNFQLLKRGNGGEVIRKAMLLEVKVLVVRVKALIALVKPLLVNTKALLVMRQPLQFPPDISVREVFGVDFFLGFFPLGF